MKTNLLLSSKLWALALVAVAASALAQTETALPSTVVRVSGGARASIDGKKWTILKLGDVIASGSWVQTAKTGDLDVLIGEQVKPSATEAFYNPEARPANFVSLSPDSLLKLDKVVTKTSETGEASTEISLELRQGAVTGNVKKQTGSSKYEISYPIGVAGMRDTIYKLRANGQLSVLKGKAFVASTDNTTVAEVAEGNEIDTASGAVGPVTNTPDPVPSPLNGPVIRNNASTPLPQATPERATPERAPAESQPSILPQRPARRVGT